MSAIFKGRWIVNEKYRDGGGPFEVSVVRQDNKHGQESYGWDGADKHILISGEAQQRTYRHMRPHILEHARGVAKRFNADDQTKGEK